jgi:hypothetical protein
MTKVKLGTALALSAVVAVAASTATVATTNLGSAPTSVVQEDDRVLPDGTPVQDAVPNAVIGVGAGSEMMYVPITPCRIVDTRKPGAGGKIAPGAQRSFVVKGTASFAAQGGKSGGCGIPNSATAVTAAFTTSESTGKGRLNAYPVGATEPNSTVLSYTNANKVTTGSTLALAKTGSPHLRVHNYDFATHFGIDITGYYAPQMAAYINPAGTIVDASSRLVSSTKNATGVYTLVWDRDISNCVGNASSDITAHIESVYTSNNISYVYVVDKNGTPQDYWINVVITC